MDIGELKEKVEQGLASVVTFEDARRLRQSLMGRKGLFSEYLEGLKQLDKEQKKEFGREINLLKGSAEARLAELERRLGEEEKEKAEARARVDITLPGKVPVIGKRHPIT